MDYRGIGEKAALKGWLRKRISQRSEQRGKLEEYGITEAKGRLKRGQDSTVRHDREVR